MSGTGAVTSSRRGGAPRHPGEMFDLDGSGVLEPSEHTVMAQTIADREALDREQGKRRRHAANGPGKIIHDAMTLAFNDRDGTGRSPPPSSLAASDRLFPMIDRNGDGVVDTADFGSLNARTRRACHGDVVFPPHHVATA